MKIGKEIYLNNLNINVESIVEEESTATKIMLEQEIEKIIKKYAISKNIVEMMAELMSILEVCEAFYLIVSIRNINLDEYVSYINYELDSYRFMDNSNNIRINYDKDIGLNVQKSGKIEEDILSQINNKIINISKLNALSSQTTKKEKSAKALTRSK